MKTIKELENLGEIANKALSNFVNTASQFIYSYIAKTSGTSINVHISVQNIDGEFYKIVKIEYTYCGILFVTEEGQRFNKWALTIDSLITICEYLKDNYEIDSI